MKNKHIKVLFRQAKYKLFLINEYNTLKKCNQCDCDVKKVFYKKNEIK